VSGGVYDPFRERVFAHDEIKQTDRHLSFHLVRDGDWVARDLSWVFSDPETGARRPIPGLGADEHVGAVVADGRLLAAGADGAFLLDPESGAREPVACDDALDEPVTAVAPIPPGNDPAIHLVSCASWSGLARLDLERATLRRASGASGFYVGGPDADTAYVVEDCARVVKVRFGSGEREVVFPPR
jgi:hypothetical protein